MLEPTCRAREVVFKAKTEEDQVERRIQQALSIQGHEPSREHVPARTRRHNR